MSAYRDELEAANSRADALESELQQAQHEVARLKGTALVRVGESALVPTKEAGGTARWLGAPTKLNMVREVAGELHEKDYAEVVECIRECLGVIGTTSTLQGQLTWSSSNTNSPSTRALTLSVTSRAGMTTIRVHEGLQELAGGIWGGVGGGVGGGIGWAPIMGAAFLSPWLAVATGVAVVAGVYAGCRALYRRSARKRANSLEETMDQVTELVAARCEPPEET
jgi:hypothetical protein